MPIHVLHVSQTAITGAAHCIADYVAEQVAAGMEVTVACPDGPLTSLCEQRGATVVTWAAGRSPGVGLLREARSLRRIVERARPDIVHLHCAKAGLIGRMVLRGKIPTVFSPHAWSFLAVTGVYSRLVREWERFATRWTTVMVCVSQAEAANGKGNGIRSRFEVFPNQIDLADIELIRKKDRGSVRAELGLSPGQPVAVLIARLSRQKGQDIAVEAWPAVQEVVSNAQLVLVGDGPTHESLRETLASRPDSGVRFVGTVDRETALRWMYAADVVVCPSRWEGMSLVPLEAAALGRPVVASDVDGMREAIPVQAGILVPPEQPDAFATATAQLLADPSVAMSLGEAARAATQSAKSGRDEPSAAERLSQLYVKLLSRDDVVLG